MDNSCFIKTPIGFIKIVCGETAVTEIEFTNDEDCKKERPNCQLLIEACTLLREYFSGTRKTFDFPLATKGTVFQRKTWQELKQIPYGETISYSELAARVGNIKARRAVAGANHQNRLAIVIPCHRVNGKDGSHTGYGAGIWRKKWLLEHEATATRHVHVQTH